MSRETMHAFKTKWGWCGLAASERGLKRVIIPWRNSPAFLTTRVKDRRCVARGARPHFRASGTVRGAMLARCAREHRLGQSPSQTYSVSDPVGRALVRNAGSRREVLAILRAEFPSARENARALSKAAALLRKYFEGEQVKFSLPLDLDGLTAFQKKVLAATRKIPYGRTLAYGEIAARANRPGAARAAGTALARNPLPIVVPCHRVLAYNGGAGGFSARGGVKTKIALLRMEAAKRK